MPSSEYLGCLTDIRGASAAAAISMVMDARMIVAVCLFIALFHNMISVEVQPQPPVDSVSPEIGQGSYAEGSGNCA